MILARSKNWSVVIHILPIDVVAPADVAENSEVSIENKIPPASTTAAQLGETLLVEVFADPSLDRRVVVRADHTISHPFARNVDVKGLTTQQIREKLDISLSQFFKNPQTFVSRESDPLH